MSDALNAEDLRSQTWLKLEKLLQKRLQTHRESNDGDLPVDRTSKLRGRIAELKDILAYARTNPAVEKEPPEPT